MVSLYADGQKRLFSTDAPTVGEVLRRSNVELATNDLVEPSPDTKLSQGQFNINVYRARPVLVIDGAQSYHIRSAYQSPRLLALAAGLSVYGEDQYDSSVVTDIVDSDTIGEQVVIKRAKPLTVQVDGRTRTLRTQSKVLGDALAGADIAIAPKDTVSLPLTAPVVPGMTVAITRVTEAVITQTNVLPRPVVTVTDPAVLKGVTTVRTAGADGQKTITYRVHYQNGVETKRETLQVVSQAAPVTKVVVVGTKVIFSGSVEYWRPLVEAAAAQWGMDPNTMLRIMTCESRGNASSISQFIINGEHPTGLFQYLPSTWRAAGGTDDNILDGAVQIQLTAKKMSLYGTKPWQCQ
jgi:resuscitation-promoting factor RpfB